MVVYVTVPKKSLQRSVTLSHCETAGNISSESVILHNKHVVSLICFFVILLKASGCRLAIVVYRYTFETPRKIIEKPLRKTVYFAMKLEMFSINCKERSLPA